MTLPAPLPLEDAQERLLQLAPRLPVEHVDVEGALGRYLARPLAAHRTQPAADLSAMDGYAVTAGDLAGPWKVVGESAAGHPYEGRIAAGEAVRVSTGALLPSDASGIILQEDIAREADLLRLTGTVPDPPARHVRPCGMDFAEGQIVLPAGARIGPAQAALAVAAGHQHLPVARAPRLAVIDSGDELVRDPEQCGMHQIPATNGLMLAALAGCEPVVVTRLDPVPDRIEALVEALDAAADADLIVTSGGASVGDHDLIRPALEAWGATISFWRVAIKPGKPILVAQRERAGTGQLILGLPGNPAASYVTGYFFMLPVLRAMMAAAQPLPTAVEAETAHAMTAGGARREFLRGVWNGRTVTLGANQDSSAISGLAGANVLIDRPAGAPALAPGDPVRIYLLQNGGIA